MGCPSLPQLNILNELVEIGPGRLASLAGEGRDKKVAFPHSSFL